MPLQYTCVSPGETDFAILLSEMVRAATQYPLFDVGGSLPNGFVYRPDFLSPEEERELIGYLEDLPLEHSTNSEGYIAKRRVMHFGWSYDFKNNVLHSEGVLPPFLNPYKRKIAKWLAIPETRIVEALISEYQPGAAIGWHRDNEPFKDVIGMSLAGWSTIRLRPLIPLGIRKNPKDVTSLSLEPRSVYVLQNDSRWNYQHSISKVKTLRYSITFRTLPEHMKTPIRTYHPRKRY